MIGIWLAAGATALAGLLVALRAATRTDRAVAPARGAEPLAAALRAATADAVAATGATARERAALEARTPLPEP